MRVYDPEGTSCTLSALGGGVGAKTGLYTITESGVHNLGSVTRRVHRIGNGTRWESDNTVYPFGLAGMLSATDYKHVPKVAIKNATKQGYSMAEAGSNQPIRIRKLTPKECWRLQGFSDAQYEKAAAVNSNSQLYKQAGNAVTVNVVEEIGHHIMGIVHENRGN